MPRGVGVFDWIILGIAVPVQTARIPRLRHNRIRLDEAAEHGVVPSAVVPVHAHVVLPALTGVAPNLSACATNGWRAASPLVAHADPLTYILRMSLKADSWLVQVFGGRHDNVDDNCAGRAEVVVKHEVQTAFVAAE